MRSEPRRMEAGSVLASILRGSGVLVARAPQDDVGALTPAADFQLLIELAVFLVRRRRKKSSSDRNIAGTRLKVADRRRPRDLDRQAPRSRLRGGAIRDRGQGQDNSNKRQRAHDRSPRLNRFRREDQPAPRFISGTSAREANAARRSHDPRTSYGSRLIDSGRDHSPRFLPAVRLTQTPADRSSTRRRAGRNAPPANRPPGGAPRRAGVGGTGDPH
jgi:hypothetical protein